MIKELINRYKEAISYLFFGVLTTIVNLISYKFFTILQVDLYVSVVLAWILSVVGVMVNIIHIQDMIAKLVANVIVVIVNYIFSKFLIFKK